MYVAAKVANCQKANKAESPAQDARFQTLTFPSSPPLVLNTVPNTFHATLHELIAPPSPTASAGLDPPANPLPCFFTASPPAPPPKVALESSSTSNRALHSPSGESASPPPALASSRGGGAMRQTRARPSREPEARRRKLRPLGGAKARELTGGVCVAAVGVAEADEPDGRR